jgi:hypothetical protein
MGFRLQMLGDRPSPDNQDNFCQLHHVERVVAAVRSPRSMFILHLLRDARSS